MPILRFTKTLKYSGSGMHRLQASGPSARQLLSPRKTLTASGIGFLLSLAFCFGANAASAPSNIAVSATVQATCTNTATPLAFGIYTGVQSDSSATITVTCTNTTPYTVGLNAGTAPAATVTSRRMTGAATVFLAYALFSDTGRITNWGTTAGTDTVAGTGTGNGQVLTIYGRAAAGQFPAPGVYTDTIIATVTY